MVHSSFFKVPVIPPTINIPKSKCLKEVKHEPAVEAFIGITEDIFQKPLTGIIIKKDIWQEDVRLPVTILGIWGAKYLLEDGQTTISEGGKHYIVQKGDNPTLLKIRASEVTIS